MTRLFRSLFLALLALLAGPGFGQFGPAQTVHPFGGSARLQARDLDMDGDADLFGVFNDQHLKWFENTDGLGTFGAPQSIVSVGGQCSLFFLADVDGDTDQDITISTDDEDGIQVLLNTGDGSFAPPAPLVPTNGYPGALTLADVNGDGFMDILVTLDFPAGAGFGWFPGSANGYDPLLEIPGLHSGGPSNSLVLGDLDLVGGLDVVLGAENDILLLAKNVQGNASVWEVDTLPIPAGQPGYPYRTPQLIDVDADGDLDLAESRGPAVHWLRNNVDEGGELAFTENELESWLTGGNGVFGNSPCGTGAAVVFVPSDPDLPVRWSSYTPLLNDLAFSNDLPTLPRGSNLVLADLNADGKEDLVMALGNGVSWFMNTLSNDQGTLTLPALDTLCVNGPPVQLPDAVPAGGRWYGAQIANDLLFRANIGVTVDLPMVHAAYEQDGCPLAEASMIRLLDGPVITTQIPAVICSGDAPIQMVSTPIATQWYGLDGSSILDPALFNGGYVVCEYTDATGYTCADLQGPIARWNTLPASIAPAGPFCAEDTIQTITAAAAPPFGVAWSGAIAGSTTSAATFDPAQGPGQYQIILTVSPVGPNQCGNADTLVVSVGERPVISFTTFPTYCADGTSIDLGGALPEGGVWGGLGVSENRLDPTIAGPGLHLLSYFSTTPEGCASQAATSIELASATTVNWKVEDLSLCPTDAPIGFSGAPAMGSWDAPLTADGMFAPLTSGPGTFDVRYAYTDPRGCVLINEPLQVHVGVVSEVTMEDVGALCTTTQAFDLIGSLSGSWSGAISAEGPTALFDPAVLGAGTWTVTLTAALPDECPGSVSQDIVVDICAGIEESRTIEPMLAPNPFTGTTLLRVNSSGLLHIDVLDAAGRVVRSNTSAASGAVAIDLLGEPAGVYVVRVVQDGRAINLRAIKTN